MAFIYCCTREYFSTCIFNFDCYIKTAEKNSDGKTEVPCKLIAILFQHINEIRSYLFAFIYRSVS